MPTPISSTARSSAASSISGWNNLSKPALVLVHGGQHSADCWDLTIDELRHLAPELPVLAVDMPGHGSTPGDLTTVTIAECVRSAVDQIENAGLREVIVVGHSLAGLTVPGIVAALGRSRVREMILAAACLPVQGTAIVDTLVGPLAWYVRRAVRLRKPPATMPNVLSALIFCNGMSRAQRRFTMSRVHTEATTIIAEPVDRSDLPDDVPRTWILTLRDHALFRRTQLRSIAALGGVQTLIPVDTCHDLMISEPRLLAEVLIDRCKAAETTCIT
jgi:pimeloyl-ACP methyl ester carboxylesterase